MTAIATLPSAPTEWYDNVPRSIGKQTLFGFTLMALAFGGFGTWGATAPLASAVIAPGTFVATGANKIVQHLEGGIIRDILVQEGDVVREGQPVIKLEESAALAKARRLQVRLFRLEAVLARLQAVASASATYIPPVTVPTGILEAEIRSIIDSQEEHFQSSRNTLNNTVDVLTQNVAALQFQHQGLMSHIGSLEQQKALIAIDLEAQTTLLDRGVATRSTVHTVERAMIEIEGNISRLQSDVQITLSQIERYNREIVQVRDAHQQAALDEIQGVEGEMESLREELRDAENILERTTLVAPVSGVVVRLHYHTAGGVISSGTAILEILPSDVPLIIEAQIPRMQIDDVKVNQAAMIRLPALNQRTTPMLEGEVIYVSADSILDTRAGGSNQEIYVARVTIPPQQLSRVDNFSPTPGMPAEILIQTEERTFFEYLAKPVIDSMSRAFRER